jgi:hypothetical protein
MPTFRDQSLIPTDAVRLAALGLLAAGPRRYGELAGEVRAFAARMLGPTLEILGTSIELLRYEGLIEAIGRKAGPSQSLTADTEVQLTDFGRAALHELLLARIRAPMTDLSRMIVALKLRFLHLLSIDEQRGQIEMLIEMAGAELARLVDLRGQFARAGDPLGDWLVHESALAEQRLAWYRERLAQT